MCQLEPYPVTHWRKENNTGNNLLKGSSMSLPDSNDLFVDDIGYLPVRNGFVDPEG